MEPKFFIYIGFLLFSIGLFGVLTRKNAIGILMGLELMLNSVNINFVALSKLKGNLIGQAFTFFSIAVTVAEVAVGLAIIILIFRTKGTVDADKVDLMKW